MKSHPRPSFSVSLLALALGASACTTKEEDKKHPDTHEPDGGDETGGKGGGGGSSTGGKGGNGGNGGGTVGSDSGAGGSTGPDGGGPDGGVFTLAGQLTVGDQLFVDSDTADVSIDPTPNDDETVAQKVGNPSFIGGYLGPLNDNTQDNKDVYLITLAKDDAATLYIATPDTGPLPDFDLYLFPADNIDINNPADSSEGVDTPIEIVQAPASGNYILVVNAPPPSVQADAGDTGRYTLSIGKAPTTNAVKNAQAHKFSSKFDYVPGEAIVKLRPGVNAVTKTWANMKALPIGKSRNVVGSVRVALQAPGLKSLKGIGINSTLAPTNKLTTLAAIKQLARRPEVLYAEPNYIRKIHAVAPNDPLYKYQWHYPQVNLLQAWDHTQGENTIVAVLDTGVKLSHPDFKNSDNSSQLIAGYDMIEDPEIAADGDGRDANPDDPGDEGVVNESSWHGSHTSGTIAAATGNGIGCAGVAPKAKIMPVRVLGVGGGTTDDIVQGILYASGLDNDTGKKPAKKADVINMSLGGKGLSRATAAAIAAARSAGVIVVVSAGNDDTDAAVYSPAGEAGVVTVSATDLSKKRAYYSNYGSVVEVAAPGGDESKDLNSDGVPDGVMSLVYARNGNALYSPYEGTSMAAPHVAGIVALMKSVYPAMTPDIFDTMLKATGAKAIVEDLGDVGKDVDFGYGLINANQAVLAALDATSTPAPDVPVVQLSAASLDFGSDETELPLEIRNVGRGTLTVSNAATAAPFSITPGAAGTNTVKVNRTGLANGVTTGTLTVTTNGGNATVALRVTSKDSAVPGGDVGPVYILLVNPQTNEAVVQTVTSAADQYKWVLEQVPPAEYLVVGGTDIDNNNIVNDEGEAFGAFPLLSDPQIINFTAGRTDLDFPVRFQFSVAAARAGTKATGVKYRRH